MKYDLVSDLHVDSHPWYSSRKIGEDRFLPWSTYADRGRVLVVGGDSSNQISITLDVISEASKHYERVVFVDGNHEHYTGSRTGKTVAVHMDEFRAGQPDWTNVTYLDGENEFLLDGTLFIGANGWYDFRCSSPEFPTELQEKAWERHIADSRYVLFDKPPRLYAKTHAEALQRKVEAAQFRSEVTEIVICTHSSPVREGVKKNPTDYTWTLINGSFANTLMSKITKSDVKKKIKHWVFGHTHFRNDFKKGHVRFISAPRGYYREINDGWEWSQPLILNTEE